MKESFFKWADSKLKLIALCITVISMILSPIIGATMVITRKDADLEALKKGFEEMKLQFEAVDEKQDMIGEDIRAAKNDIAWLTKILTTPIDSGYGG